jgi:branched-chain amino acid transport system substrate-binding protein
MDDFAKRYAKVAGEWNDEAGTKVYALEIILATLQKNPKAVSDVKEFKKTVESFGMANPFLKDKATLKFVGRKYFDQPRQIGVPVVVNEYKNGEFQTVFVGAVAD